MHRLSLGDFELTAVSDGTYPLDGGALFGVVPKVIWSKKVAVDENNFVSAGLNSVVVRTGRETVLIETGIGNKLPENMLKIYGQPAKLLGNLEAAGISSDDIDIVINSHLHFDHCGWNTVRQGDKIVPAFPRSKILCAARRMGARAFRAARRRKLSHRKLRSPGREWADAATARRSGNCAGDFGESFSWAYARHAGRDHHQRRPDRLLYLGPDSDYRAPRVEHVGMGFDLYPLQTIESQQAVLRAVGAGEVADHVYPRSQRALGVCGEE